jgi:hypothetical protein
MRFPVVIQGEIKVETASYKCDKAVLEKLAQSVKREGGTNVAADGNVLSFSGITGQASVSPLVNIVQSSVTIASSEGLVRLIYVLRAETWGVVVAGIMIAVGAAGWLLSVLPLEFPAGPGLALLIIWVLYLPIVRFRYESFLRRSLRAHRVDEPRAQSELR